MAELTISADDIQGAIEEYVANLLQRNVVLYEANHSDSQPDSTAVPENWPLLMESFGVSVLRLVVELPRQPSVRMPPANCAALPSAALVARLGRLDA